MSQHSCRVDDDEFDNMLKDIVRRNENLVRYAPVNIFTPKFLIYGIEEVGGVPQKRIAVFEFNSMPPSGPNELLYNSGLTMAKKTPSLFPVAVFIVADARVSRKTDVDDVLDGEAVIVIGSTLDGRHNMAIQPVARDESNAISLLACESPDAEWEEVAPIGSDPIQSFMDGFVKGSSKLPDVPLN